MSTIEKGNKLEDEFYDYLCDQRDRGALVYGAYSPELCKIHKKKKYRSRDREGLVDFDVVIEFFRQGGTEPHLFIVFECKNHTNPVQERDVRDFSDKIKETFGHSGKGCIVVASRLQSGAENVAKNRRMGIVKYDEHGFEVVAERKGGISAETGYVKSQIFTDTRPVKSLKFAAYRDGRFFGAIDQFLESFDPSLSVEKRISSENRGNSVPFVSHQEIQQSAQKLLERIDYQSGPVDVVKICSILSIDLVFTEQLIEGADGKLILGSANFHQKSIAINAHADKRRERFTICHEIGHFWLRHDRYLLSETIVESDLLIGIGTDSIFNCERLEFQANAFGSELLLPEEMFRAKINEYRIDLDIKDRGHGYIFVDDQACNISTYYQLLSNLSSEFEVSKQAIEIKLKKMGRLTDHRKMNASFFTTNFEGRF